MRSQSQFGRAIRLALGLTGLTAAACTDVEIYPPSSLEIPADRIDDASLRYDGATAHVVLAWTAPGTNGGTEKLARYDIRFEYADTLTWSARPDGV